MIDDPIVDDVRKAGEAYFAKFNFDMTAICEDLRRQAERQGHQLVSLPPRPPTLLAKETKKVG